MSDKKITAIAGTALPLRGDEIDTDRIIPARFLKCVTFDGLGEHAFADDRAELKEKGEVHPFDNQAYAGAGILLVNKNFGCGSSREHAPQSLMRHGIRCIIGESYSEIFYGNNVANGVPCLRVSKEQIEEMQSLAEAEPTIEFSVDVASATVTAGSKSWTAELPEGVRNSFLDGSWDSTFQLLEGEELIRQTAARLPYVNHWQ